MTTPEINSGEGLSREHFARVSAIVIPGDYRFSTDPNTSHKRYYKRTDYEFIAGEKPSWEKEVLEILKRMRGISYTALNSEEENRNTNVRSRWESEEGYLRFGEDSCHVLFSSGFDGGQAIGHLTLMDESIIGETAKKIVKDGVLALQLVGDSPDVFHFQPAWQGWLNISGDPSDTIKKAVEVLNKKVNIGDVPLWKQKD